MEDIKVKLSEDFGVETIKLADYLEKLKVNSAIISQILRSGTSIGANIYESVCAESKQDFIHKLKISEKEASETQYWLKILYRSKKLDEKYFNDLMEKCSTIKKIISSIITSTKRNLQSQ